MAFSIEKYANDENPEFMDVPQVKTENIVGKNHILEYVEFGRKKDGTDFVRVKGNFDGDIMWYYTASYGLVGTLKRVFDDLGNIPKVAVFIDKIDIGGKNPMFVYKDA